MKLEREYWRKLIKEYDESGLSQAEFCSQQGIQKLSSNIVGVKKWLLTARKNGLQQDG